MRKKNEIENLKDEIRKQNNKNRKSKKSKKEKIVNEIEELNMVEASIEPDLQSIENEEVEEETITLKESKKRSIKKELDQHKDKIVKYGLFVALPICIILLIFSFMISNKLSKKVFSNVYLNNINMSKLTLEQLEEKVISVYTEKSLSEIVPVHQGEKLLDQIIAEDIDFKVDVEKTIEKIYSYGRKKGIILNNYNILKALFSKVNLDYEYEYSEEKLEQVIELLSTSIEGKVVDDKYELDESKNVILLTKGKEGIGVDKEDLKEKILSALERQSKNIIQIKEEKKSPKGLDIEEIYKNVKRDAVDATVIREEGKLPVFKKEVIGYDLDKESLKAEIAKKEHQVPESTFEFALNVIQPKVKYQDIAWEAYENVLGQKTTYFPSDAYNRIRNLELALAKLNNVVIMPGEVFSYNKVVGPINASTGYKPAGVFKNGTVEQEIGGGVCQTSSTLYNAVLYANLEVVERKNHGLIVNYVQPSLDATIYQYSIDFKFRNNRNYPIKITTWINKGGSMGVKVLGTKEDTDYEIQLISKVIKRTPFSTVQNNDPTLAVGTTKVKLAGANGLVSEAYKVYKKNGVTVKTELLSRDTYKPTNKIVLVGTKGKQASEVPNVEEDNNTVETNASQEIPNENVE